MDGYRWCGDSPPRKKWQDLRFWGLILSSFLGVVFLLVTAIHFNDVRMQSSTRLQDIQQQARQAETELNIQLGSEEFQQQVTQQRTQLETQLRGLLENPDQVNQLLESEQTPQQLRALLEASQENPEEIDRFLDEQAHSFPNNSVDKSVSGS